MEKKMIWITTEDRKEILPLLRLLNKSELMKDYVFMISTRKLMPMSKDEVERLIMNLRRIHEVM